MFRASMLGALVATLLALAPSASAHENRAVGAVEMTVGWLTEPAFAGAVNGVSFRARRGGAAVAVASLKVDVTFAGAAEPLTLTLAPAFRDPGHYEAHLIPTRSGAYTFRIYGRIAGTAFDQTFTSGADTFDPIEAATQIEYPEKDPTRDELAQRAAAQETRIEDLRSIAAKAQDAADLAKVIAIVALVVGLAGVVVGMRRARTAASR